MVSSDVEALDGRDGAIGAIHREGDAGTLGFAVDQDGTGAADALLAAKMRTGKIELFA